MGYYFGFKRKFAVSALSLSMFWCIGASAEPLAFPEALGFGANVTGGRAGTVYHVTNLNDDGKGSFRDAVSQGNRIVVFDVGGIINIKTAVSIKSNITIAGQTAPGEGIAIHGGKLSTGKQSNIIIRYLRIRPGENTASTKDDALNLYDAKNVIVDHCSVELAPWNNFGGSSDNADYRVTGITVQNSLIANPIGQQFGAHIESIDGTWAWYYNAFVNTHNRNPLDKINDIFVNNILYNFEAGYTTHTSAKFKHDIVNNYFVYGPEGKNEWFQVDKNQSIYANGNLIDKNRDGVLNGGPTSIYYYQGPGEELKNPWNELTIKGPMMSAASAWRYVTSQSGVLPYDDIDSLIWHQVGTLGKEGALVKSVGAMGLKTNNGWGEVIAGKAATDSDKDGMPDYFEEAMGYDTAKDDAMTKESDGYVRIEKYINWLGAMHAQVAGNGTLDFDLRTITRGFQSVKPTYSVSAAENGTVELAGDGYTARFTPDKDFKGLASFKYTVKGNDNTEYTGRVEVLVEKSANASEPPEQPRDSSETAQDSSKTAQDSTTAIRDAFREAHTFRNAPQTHKNSFHDLKGRRFEKQIPYRVLF
ncbi:MAG: Ig-like domain-containing protein [Fibrobacter sp.]|nr:Ig-like domain-containing protein [Fibrobacter sp.]